MSERLGSVDRRLFGDPGAAMRTDAFAMAIWNGIAVDELINVDLCYAPPLSGVWEVANVAARRLQRLLG